MADPKLYNDQQKWNEVSMQYEECKLRLKRNYGCWEQAQEKIDGIDSELGLNLNQAE